MYINTRAHTHVYINRAHSSDYDALKSLKSYDRFFPKSAKQNFVTRDPTVTQLDQYLLF